MTVLLAPLLAPAALPAQLTKAACSAAPYQQFDFWVGNWDTYDIDQPAKIVAHNRVERILDGCVLLENYQATDGMHGESFTIYDASRQLWSQTWVTNAGRLLTIEGTFKGGEMTLNGSDRTADGKRRLVRGTWRAVPDGVRETATTSLDAGKSWQPWFDILFRPHKP